MSPQHLPALALAAFAASFASPADAGGPYRSSPLLGQPVFGVYPTAPAAVAPSFRQPVPRVRIHGVRPFVSIAVPLYGVPPVVYAAPAYGDVPPVEAVAPAPPPPPAAPPPPQVVEYDGGRYELRGDGIGAPYRWVWIPDPPRQPQPVATRPGPTVTLYGWTDEQGAIHVTDRLDRVPERHRAQAKRNAAS